MKVHIAFKRFISDRGVPDYYTIGVYENKDEAIHVVKNNIDETEVEVREITIFGVHFTSWVTKDWDSVVLARIETHTLKSTNS